MFIKIIQIILIKSLFNSNKYIFTYDYCFLKLQLKSGISEDVY